MKTTGSAYEKVMVIDDTTIDLYITSRIIVKNDFARAVMQYNNAKEALLYLKENEGNVAALPDVIFIDIYMPIMSGFEFMESYDKLNPVLKENCQVFIISSTTDEHDIEKVHNDKNIIAFQEKPVTKEFLKSIQEG